MQFLIFIIAVVLMFIDTLATYGCVVLLSSPALGKVEFNGWRKAVVYGVSCLLILVGTVKFGGAACIGGLVGLAAFHCFYKRFLRTR